MAKIHFWSLHLGSNLILVLKFILRLPQSLKIKNHFHFGPCCQPTNKKVLLGKQNA